MEGSFVLWTPGWLLGMFASEKGPWIKQVSSLEGVQQLWMTFLVMFRHFVDHPRCRLCQLFRFFLREDDLFVTTDWTEYGTVLHCQVVRPIADFDQVQAVVTMRMMCHHMIDFCKECLMKTLGGIAKIDVAHGTSDLTTFALVDVGRNTSLALVESWLVSVTNIAGV